MDMNNPLQAYSAKEHFSLHTIKTKHELQYFQNNLTNIFIYQNKHKPISHQVPLIEYLLFGASTVIQPAIEEYPKALLKC